MATPGYKDARVEHVVAALEQMDDVIYRLLKVFRPMDQKLVLAETRDPAQPQPAMMAFSAGTVPRIEPLPVLKDNCT